MLTNLKIEWRKDSASQNILFDLSGSTNLHDSNKLQRSNIV